MKCLLGIFICVLCACVICCTKPDDVIHQLKSDKTTINLPGMSGSKDSISIQSDVDWTISFDPATTIWVKASESSGSGNRKVYFTVMQNNTTGVARTATVVITPSDKSGLLPLR